MPEHKKFTVLVDVYDTRYIRQSSCKHKYLRETTGLQFTDTQNKIKIFSSMFSSFCRLFPVNAS